MADIDISAVSAVYTGTPQGDNFTRSTGNLRDITVLGLQGDDTLAIGSAVLSGTGAGGLGLGFSLASSTILMGEGDDIYTFSGQAGSGFARQNQTLVELGQGNDFTLINGLASASGATVKGNAGEDEIGFVGFGNTAFRTLVEGNQGDDYISATWGGIETKNFEIYGGQGQDTISATFTNVSAYNAATAFVSGVYVAGGKGNDQAVVTIFGTSEAVVAATNTGNDSLGATFNSNISGAQLFGGEGDDGVVATLAGVGVRTSQAVFVYGNRGNDSAGLNVAPGSQRYLSAVQVLGGSGSDALRFTVGGGATAGSANGVFGGSGTDTLNISVTGGLRVQGASGFVADLGTEASGGVINVNTRGFGIGIQGAAVFRGSTGADTLSINALTGGNISGSILSGEAGADAIGLRKVAGAAGLVAVKAFGGDGADTITATLAGLGGFFGTAGEGNVLNLGSGDDVATINLATGTVVTAVSVLGGAGADSITVNIATGGAIASRGNTAGNNFSIAGESGADVIGLVGARSAAANAEILGGSGNDTITGTFINNTAVSVSAGGGAGADSLSFLTQGSAGGNFSASVFAGNSGADAIQVTFGSGRRTAAALNAHFGTIAGGTGADSIVVDLSNYGAFTTAGFATGGGVLSGNFDAGQGADSISVLGLTGAVANQLTGVNIRLASGDSLVGGFDTYFFQTTAGGGALTGVSASFSGFADNAFATAASINTGGGFQASFSGGVGNSATLTTTGGLVLFRRGAPASAGNNLKSAGNQFIRAGAGTTTADIISAVDRVVVGVNRIATFNIQEGSAGRVNGYMFIQGGVNPDTVVRMNGIAKTATQNQIFGNAAGSANLVFRAGGGNFTVSNAGVGGSGGITFGGAL